MSPIGQGFGKLFKGIGNALDSVWSSIVSFFSVADRVEARVQALVTNIDALVLNVDKEIQAFKDFKFDPKWKTRVINVPIAIDQIKDFIFNVPDDIIDTLKSTSADLKALFDLFKHGPPGSSPADSVGAIGKLTGWASAVDQSFEVLEKMVDDLGNIVDDLRQIREQIEGLDAFFLGQGRSRRWIKERSYKRIDV